MFTSIYLSEHLTGGTQSTLRIVIRFFNPLWELIVRGVESIWEIVITAEVLYYIEWWKVENLNSIF